MPDRTDWADFAPGRSKKAQAYQGLCRAFFGASWGTKAAQDVTGVHLTPDS